MRSTPAPARAIKRGGAGGDGSGYVAGIVMVIVLVAVLGIVVIAVVVMRVIVVWCYVREKLAAEVSLSTRGTA